MSVLHDEKSRADLLNRLKRAEGQLRGIQRMIEGGEAVVDIASQMSAVRKALDSTYVRMTISVMEQELAGKSTDNARGRKQMAEVMDEVQTLLAKVR
ncbi:MAG: hypothetical protein C4K60_01285 [Ideonella sp. MAG2]|nr:MAG: hypothetical protein C4K60_01285 [Ideonella sp. MAG2]